MKEFSVKCGSEANLFLLLENLAAGQSAIQGLQEENGYTSENHYALMTLSNIIAQATRQLAEHSEGRK